MQINKTTDIGKQIYLLKSHFYKARKTDFDCYNGIAKKVEYFVGVNQVLQKSALHNKLSIFDILCFFYISTNKKLIACHKSTTFCL